MAQDDGPVPGLDILDQLEVVSQFRLVRGQPGFDVGCQHDILWVLGLRATNGVLGNP